MSKQRYEISIAYTNKNGRKCYVNNVGSMFFDGEKGSIVLPPGVALTGGEGFYINVSLPRERPAAGGGGRQGGGNDDSGSEYF